MSFEDMNTETAKEIIEDVMLGARKHDSLADASSYAMLMEDAETATFLSEKLKERNNLIKELVDLHLQSNGALLPGVPTTDRLTVFMAIERLAETNPGIHPIVAQVAGLDKLQYMTGEGFTHSAPYTLN